MFSLWDNKNVCQSWQDTLEWAELLGLETVPTLYQGIWDEEKILALATTTHDGDECEGYVVRLADPFHYKDFRRSVGKFVRKDHVRTHGHWTKRIVEYNRWVVCKGRP
jgi:hypothetical protein